MFALLLLLVSVTTIHVEVNNIHNGFKIVLEGQATSESDYLRISNPVQLFLFLENIGGYINRDSRLFRILEHLRPRNQDRFERFVPNHGNGIVFHCSDGGFVEQKY